MFSMNSCIVVHTVQSRPDNKHVASCYPLRFQVFVFFQISIARVFTLNRNVIKTPFGLQILSMQICIDNY